MNTDEFFEHGQGFIAQHWPLAFLAVGVFFLLGAILNWNWLCDPKEKGDRNDRSLSHMQIGDGLYCLRQL